MPRKKNRHVAQVNMSLTEADFCELKLLAERSVMPPTRFALLLLRKAMRQHRAEIEASTENSL